MLGEHAVKHWSSTQTSVALSSGEAEFAGVIRGAGQGLGYQALLSDLGVTVPLRVWTDSSAAIGICSRQGLGKMRHLDTHTLWIQQAVRSGRVDLRKISGDENPADLLTKHSLSNARLGKLVELFGCRYLGGRAASAPQMRRGDSTKKSMADADEALGAVGGDAQDPLSSSDGATPPIMPHVEYPSEAELDARFPRLVAPEEEQLRDPDDDKNDAVLQKGMEIARRIQEDAVRDGRRRHPVRTVSGTSSETGNCRSNVQDSIASLQLHRRRSKKIDNSPATVATTSRPVPSLDSSCVSECLIDADIDSFVERATSHWDPYRPPRGPYRRALRSACPSALDGVSPVCD